MHYYNELDHFAAAWLRELIKAGHIVDGVVDERSIEEVQAHELKEYAQCHFFAGIGGWSYALRLAGWPDDRLVWTGSCPCPSFSAAGKGQGFRDARHLWPYWFRLIRECRPATIFGEQVDDAIGHGWIDLVQTDLEAENYAVGKAVLGAASVGAPHIRQRLYFVADSELDRRHDGRRLSGICDAGNAGNQKAKRSSIQRETEGLCDANFWRDARWIPCRDGKSRPVEPGTFPLAHGVTNRVGRLRGYGNAIVPQVAEAFIRTFLDTNFRHFAN
jgi:DNA (cytosine-5)-methyltransferase 1